MSELEPQPSGVINEVLSSVTNEFIKAVAMLQGADQMTAAAIGGAAGGAIKAVHPAFVAAMQRWDRRLTIATTEAANVAGGDLKDLLIKALDDDRKIELLVRALETAQKTADVKRVRFYGRIAAKGALAEDDARVDETQRIFASLAALDAVDLKVLLHMAKEDREWRTEHADGEPGLMSELPEVGAVFDAVMPRLEAQGLISSNVGSTFFTSPPTWHVTDYGKLCIRELLEPSGELDDEV